MFYIGIYISLKFIIKPIMKRIALVILQLFISITVFTQTYKYTSTQLNFRSGPSVTSNLISTIPSGTSVLLTENCDCPWIKVIYNGNIGYVSSKYLKSHNSNDNKKLVNNLTNKSSKIKHYTNSRGERVQSPTYYNSVPAGATALCRDGTYSFSRSRRGTCSHHGGVAKWL